MKAFSYSEYQALCFRTLGNTSILCLNFGVLYTTQKNEKNEKNESDIIAEKNK